MSLIYELGVGKFNSLWSFIKIWVLFNVFSYPSFSSYHKPLKLYDLEAVLYIAPYAQQREPIQLV